MVCGLLVTWEKGCLACQGKPCRESRELFVLSPRRAKGFAKRGDAALERHSANTERLRRNFIKVFLFHCFQWQMATSASSAQGVAEKFAIRCVDERVRGKDLLQSRQYAARGHHNRAAAKFLVLDC